ncbi:hypothetical protein DFH29DRAFT_1075852 [Suillus ampliporus]|nr:hypothetical protein DFH29DRAFT_1075852 [Suillus ampliporus]
MSASSVTYLRRFTALTLAVCAFIIAVADSELEDVRHLLLYPPDQVNPDKEVGWTGYALSSAGFDNCPLYIVPVSLQWKLDLSPEEFESTTFMHSTIRYRFPRLEPYINALIEIRVERNISSRYDTQILLYLNVIFADVVKFGPRFVPVDLPLENRFYLEWIRKMYTPKGRATVGQLRQKICAGEMTLDKAITHIPTRDLMIGEMEKRLRSIADRFTRLNSLLCINDSSMPSARH